MVLQVPSVRSQLSLTAQAPEDPMTHAPPSPQVSGSLEGRGWLQARAPGWSQAQPSAGAPVQPPFGMVTPPPSLPPAPTPSLEGRDVHAASAPARRTPPRAGKQRPSHGDRRRPINEPLPYPMRSSLGMARGRRALRR